MEHVIQALFQKYVIYNFLCLCVCVGGGGGGGVAEELVGLPTERKMYSLTFVLMLNIKFQVPTSSGSLVLTQTKGVTVRGITLIGVGRGGPGGARPPNNLRGRANIPFGPPNNPPTCTGKTIPLNSILEFSIISYFKMRNVIIWH